MLNLTKESAIELIDLLNQMNIDDIDHGLEYGEDMHSIGEITLNRSILIGQLTRFIMTGIVFHEHYQELQDFIQEVNSLN
jgi:hypothetical protein